jgi:hypothetical protein
METEMPGRAKRGDRNVDSKLVPEREEHTRCRGDPASNKTDASQLPAGIQASLNDMDSALAKLRSLVSEITARTARLNALSGDEKPGFRY